jgi:hypothetical protein
MIHIHHAYAQRGSWDIASGRKLDSERGFRLSTVDDTAVVEHYISIVAHRVRLLMERIADAGQPAYASSATASLSEILVRILSRFFDELRSLHQEINDHPPEDTVRQVRTIHLATVKIVHELVEAIRMASSSSPAASIVEAYAQIASLVQHGTQTIIHPTWDYNASCDEIMTTLRTMTGRLGRDTGEAVFSGAPRSFLVITYPVSEEEMVLRHAFIAHELGHFIDHIEGWSNSILETQVFDEEDRDCIMAAVQSTEDEEEWDQTLERALILAGEIAPFWIGEVIADVLGVGVLGPAYLLAFDEVSPSPRFSSPHTLSRSHPPGSLRREIISRLTRELYLEPIRSKEVFEKLSRDEQAVFSEVFDWIAAIVDTDPPEFASTGDATGLPAEVIRAVYSALRNAVDRSVTWISAEKLGRIRQREWFCTPTDIVDALRLQDLLSYGLTPTELYCEASRDPSFAAVMNSGWFRFVHAKKDYLYFRDLPNESHPDQIYVNYSNLQNLIAKAIESLQFKREFLRRRGTECGRENATY